MGAAFDKWLAKPSTFHFLRHLIAPCNGRASSRLTLTRDKSFSTGGRRNALLSSNDQDVNDTQRKQPKGNWGAVRPGRQHILNPAELGLQMSLSAGVPLLGKEGDADAAFSELRFQADVNSPTAFGKLLVDEEEHRQNAKLWIEILRFRQRIDGFEGVLDVWKGMRSRSVDLPVSGSEADILWTAFIHAGIASPEDGSRVAEQLLSEVYKYAENLKTRSGDHYEGLYKRIVGRSFRVKRDDARKWHHHLCHVAKLAKPEDLGTIVIDVMLNASPQRAFRIFSQMYRTSEVRDLYDSCIPEVLKLEDDAAALRCHRLFIRHGDGPSTEVFNTPGVQRLFALDNDSSLPMKKAAKDRKFQGSSSIADFNDPKARFPPLTRQSMNSIVGDVYGIKPKEISDTFCARLFATRAFSLDLVIKGLSFLGVESLGPLAVREMAVRAGSPVDFSNRLTSLKDYGIKISQSAFARLVVKLANDGESGLWTALLESDQHPDVYEDAAMQEKLLISFLDEQNWKQAHVALTALSFTDHQAHLRAWNRVLQHYIILKDLRPMLSTMQSIQNQGLPLTLYSLALMRRHVLPERRRTKRPIQQHGPKFFNPLDFVRNACIYSAEHGHFVPANLWTELLKRYGMANRWGATERLALWLFDFYSSKVMPSNEDLDNDNSLRRSQKRTQTRMLRMVFSRTMLKAFFTWGYRSHAARMIYVRPLPDNWRRCRHEPWARGLEFLKRLHDRGILDIKDDARKAFRLRMWSLFGAGVSTLGINNSARRLNRIPLAHYINHANEIWGGLIDWVDPALLTKERQNDSQLLVSFFGPQHSTNRKISEYADVKAWTRSMGKTRTSYYLQAASVPKRKQMWERSSFRMIRPKQAIGSNTSQTVRRRRVVANEHKVTTLDGIDSTEVSRQPPQERQSPSAHSLSWRPQPSPQYIPEPL